MLVPVRVQGALRSLDAKPCPEISEHRFFDLEKNRATLRFKSGHCIVTAHLIDRILSAAKRSIELVRASGRVLESSLYLDDFPLEFVRVGILDADR